jgi:hypothetical protein
MTLRLSKSSVRAKYDLVGLTLPLGSAREPKPQIELILEVKSAIRFILGNPIAAYLAKNAICGQVRRLYEN